jgi:hypothetical protein
MKHRIYIYAKFRFVSTETCLQISYEAFSFFKNCTCIDFAAKESEEVRNLHVVCLYISCRSLHPHLYSSGVNLELRNVYIDICVYSFYDRLGCACAQV